MMMRVCFLIQLLCLFTLLVSFTPCDARKSMRSPRGLSLLHLKSKSGSMMIKGSKKLKIVSKFNLLRLISNVAPYVASPFGSMPPVSLPENSPPYCIYPPPPSTPFTTTPVTPIGGGGTPDSPYIPPFLPLPGPPTGTVPAPPYTFPSPTSYIPSPSYSFPGPPSGSPDFGPSPPFYIPGPPGPTLSPPPYFEPSPPTLVPSPPTSYVPSPGGFVPTPPVFEPPVVFPPPTVPPPPRRASGISLWCVAKPSVPDPIIEEAMNYACGSGADCDSIQPSGSCYQPDTLFAHASYAFNSYWQRTKVAGGTCEFGGTAMLVTVDPSYDGCHFLYY